MQGQGDEQHLIPRRRIWRPPRADQNGVRMLPVRDDRAALVELGIAVSDLDRADTRADVAANSLLRRCRRKQQLLGAEPFEKPPVPTTGALPRNEICDQDLVHRKDHAGRAAVARQRAAGRSDVVNAGAFATVFTRHHNAEHSAGLEGLDRLHRKASIAVNRIGTERSDFATDLFSSFDARDLEDLIHRGLRSRRGQVLDAGRDGSDVRKRAAG